MILTIFAFFILVLDMSSPGNPISWIISIELLTGANYPQWREKVNMRLVLFEIEKAIIDKRLVEPTPEENPDDLSTDAKAQREREKAKLMECYQIENFN
jgi:ribonucleotide reductase alpha subunit